MITTESKQFILGMLRQNLAQMQQQVQFTTQAIAELEQEQEPCRD